MRFLFWSAWAVISTIIIVKFGEGPNIPIAIIMVAFNWVFQISRRY